MEYDGSVEPDDKQNGNYCNQEPDATMTKTEHINRTH